MLIDDNIIRRLLAQAESHSRKRAYLGLRNREEDESQRMIVAVLPSDAKEVIHRHRDSSESLAILRGSATEIFYDDKDNEPSVFMESKAGKYEAVKPENLLEI